MSKLDELNEEKYEETVTAKELAENLFEFYNAMCYEYDKEFRARGLTPDIDKIKANAKKWLESDVVLHPYAEMSPECLGIEAYDE